MLERVRELDHGVPPCPKVPTLTSARLKATESFLGLPHFALAMFSPFADESLFV